MVVTLQAAASEAVKVLDDSRRIEARRPMPKGGEESDPTPTSSYLLRFGMTGPDQGTHPSPTEPQVRYDWRFREILPRKSG